MARHSHDAPFSGQPLAATLPCAVRTFLQCFVSKIAPAAVWQASRDALSRSTEGQTLVENTRYK